MSTAAPPQKAPPPRERTGGRLSNGAFALLLTAPGLALFAAIIFYPLLSALFTGFFRQDLRLAGREFVGLDNFAHWLDGDFLTILEQTLVFTVGATLVPFVIGFALALALNTGLKGSGWSVIVWLFLPRGVRPASQRQAAPDQSWIKALRGKHGEGNRQREGHGGGPGMDRGEKAQLHKRRQDRHHEHVDHRPAADRPDHPEEGRAIAQSPRPAGLGGEQHGDQADQLEHGDDDAG